MNPNPNLDQFRMQILNSHSTNSKQCFAFLEKFHSDKTNKVIFLQENCVEFEASVVAQCDALIKALEARKQELLSNIQEERDQKMRVFREQVAHCTQKLQKTTGLLQFSIEVLKESDPSAFLQVRTY